MGGTEFCLSFLLLSVPKYELHVTAYCNHYFFSFCSAMDFSRNQELSRASHNRSLVRTGPSFSTSDLISAQTEISSAFFSIQNYQARGFMRLFANSVIMRTRVLTSLCRRFFFI